MEKAVRRASATTLIQLCKEHSVEIVPVSEAYEQEWFEEETHEENGSRVTDIGGSLTRLKAELECGIESRRKHF